MHHMGEYEIYCKVLSILVANEYAWQEAINTLLQATTDEVKKVLKKLLSFEQRRVSQDAMLRFISLLPQDEWAVFACDQMLQEPERWCSWAVALILRKAMALSTGKTLLLAEINWVQRLSNVDRAIASGSPTTITSTIGDNALYVAEGSYDYDTDNCSPFCWMDEWTPDWKKEQWRLIPAPMGSSNFYIVSVYTKGYLYASNIPVCNDSDDYPLKRVLVCEFEKLPDLAGIWRLMKLEDNRCAFYNVNHETFLTSPAEAVEFCRRAVVTSTFDPLDEKRFECREWKIKLATIPLLERGLHFFFERKYAEAVQTLTTILSEKSLSTAHRKKALSYRMVANWMLGEKDCADVDAALLEPFNGCPDYFLIALHEKLEDDDKKLLQHFAEISFSV